MDQIEVELVDNLLTMEALAWASRLLEQDHTVLTSSDSFLQAFATIFDEQHKIHTVKTALPKLQQILGSVTSHVTHFRSWTTDTSWNDVALLHEFQLGLWNKLKDVLAQIDPPTRLEAFMDLCIRIDIRLHE